MDAEDFRIIKIIVYINDIEPEDGPFSFIPKQLTPSLSRLKFTNNRVLDEDMEKFVAQSDVHVCTGPAGTVIFVDTCSVLHRGNVGISNDRHALFYAYNTKHPLRPQYCLPLYEPKTLLAHLISLSPIQLDAIA